MWMHCTLPEVAQQSSGTAGLLPHCLRRAAQYAGFRRLVDNAAQSARGCSAVSLQVQNPAVALTPNMEICIYMLRIIWYNINVLRNIQKDCRLGTICSRLETIMKFDLLTTALKMLAESDENRKADAMNAVYEIQEMQRRLGHYDEIWNGSCYILPADTVSDLLNMTTYDEYGKLYAKRLDSERYVSLNDYENACRRNAGLEFASLATIMLGYDIVKDLYADNEISGCHNADGTFNHAYGYNPTYRNAVKWLDALLLTSGESMEQEDLAELKQTIEMMRRLTDK